MNVVRTFTENIKSRPIPWVLTVAACSGGSIYWFQLRDRSTVKYRDIGDVRDKTVIITGADSGIGLAATKRFAKKNCRVIMACRDPQKCKMVRREVVIDSSNKRVACRVLDLSSFDSIKKFAHQMILEEENMEVLVNNAGVMCPKKLKSADGIEMNMAINHFGPSLLTHLLYNKLKQRNGKIINVTCEDYQHGEINKEDYNLEDLEVNHYNMHDVTTPYDQSKLSNLLWTMEFIRRKRAEKANLEDPDPVTINLVMPRKTRSELERYLKWYNAPWGGKVYGFFHHFSRISVEGASEPILYAAFHPDAKDAMGKVYEKKLDERELLDIAYDEHLAKWVYDVTDLWTRREEMQDTLKYPEITVRDIQRKKDEQNALSSTTGYAHKASQSWGSYIGSYMPSKLWW